MLDKDQILKRLNNMLTFEGIANSHWYCDQIRSLISSDDSPEIFE